MGAQTKLPGAVGASGQAAKDRHRDWAIVTHPSFGIGLPNPNDKAVMKPVFESLKGRVLFAYEGHRPQRVVVYLWGPPGQRLLSARL